MIIIVTITPENKQNRFHVQVPSCQTGRKFKLIYLEDYPMLCPAKVLESYQEQKQQEDPSTVTTTTVVTEIPLVQASSVSFFNFSIMLCNLQAILLSPCDTILPRGKGAQRLYYLLGIEQEKKKKMQRKKNNKLVSQKITSDTTNKKLYSLLTLSKYTVLFPVSDFPGQAYCILLNKLRKFLFAIPLNICFCLQNQNFGD